MKREICIVTGSRADLGILTPVIQRVAGDPDLRLKIAVTGMHLDPSQGNTICLVEELGPVDRVPMLLAGDEPGQIAKSVGLGVIGFADLWNRNKPDLVVVLGDRFEILSVVQAALFHRIPVAHLHGGEVTQGALDEFMRHAITKLSSLHFVSTETHRKRVIQMGECPETVFNVGSPAIDNALKTPFLSRADLELALNCRFAKINFVITYHPTTRTLHTEERIFEELLSAVTRFSDAKFFMTLPNADAGNKAYRTICERFKLEHPERCYLFPALGHTLYLSLVKESDVVLGNSSSGLIEVPALKKPTINLGERQRGRERGPTVVDCEGTAHAIEQNIKYVMSRDFEKVLNESKSIYGDGNASRRIVDILKTANLDDLIQKPFYDLKHHE